MIKSMLLKAFARWFPLVWFRTSDDYWKMRYRLGGGSGAGSEGSAACYKAELLNGFVAGHNIEGVLELGCGDGSQLKLAAYPRYVGVDVSPEAVGHCRNLFKGDISKRFMLLEEYKGEAAELTISIDVIYHLVEDEVYFAHLELLFSAAERYVIVYSSDVDLEGRNFQHVRHRQVSRDIERLCTDFERMTEFEQSLPPPVAFNRGVPTVFLVYRRRSS